jgi:hypothetical protein
MKAVIEGTYKVSCLLFDLWRCIGPRDVQDCQLVLVTFADGRQRLFDRDHLEQERLHEDRDGHHQLAAWQLVMLPVAEGPEQESEGLLDLVRQRDVLLEKLATRMRQPEVSKKTRAELADIDARLASLPATVFKDFREILATKTKLERMKAALEKYQCRSNWTPGFGENSMWRWAGHGSQCENIEDPWKYADQALKEG